MKQEMTKILKDSISEVFSTMFFMVPEEEPRLAEEAAGLEVKGWLRAALAATKGDETLEVYIWTSPQMSLELAANILSCEPEDVGAVDLIDAHQEMINMVLGSVLTAGDRASEWKLGLPKSHRLTGGTFGDLMGSAQKTILFAVDDKPFLAGWNLS